MARRNYFDLGHLMFCSGKIGRLQTLDMMPVYAGDSLEYHLMAGCSLSPLRQQLALDPRIDIYAYYRPHRHEYGSDWEDFVKQGPDETKTFSSTLVSDPTEMEALGMRFATSSVPRWAFGAYKAIYNRYWKDPGSADRTENTFNLNAPDDAKYGWQVCHLPAYWNIGLPDEKDQVDTERHVTVSSNQLDVLDIDKARARYGSEAAQEWFAQRDTYHDVMKVKWNTQVSKEIDKYPREFYGQKFWMNGMVVTGIDEVGYASQSGSTQVRINYKLPRFAVPEHGSVWIMMAVRYPPVIFDEVNRTATKANPSWKEAGAEGRILEFDRPEFCAYGDF